MKKFIFLFISIFIFNTSYSQVKLESVIGAKVYTFNNFRIRTENDKLTCRVGYLNFNFQESLLWKGFKASIKAENYFNSETPVRYSPKQIIYLVILSYNYKNLNMEFNHSCYHPIKCDSDKYGGLYGGYEYFGISYKF